MTLLAVTSSTLKTSVKFLATSFKFWLPLLMDDLGKTVINLGLMGGGEG